MHFFAINLNKFWKKKLCLPESYTKSKWNHANVEGPESADTSKFLFIFMIDTHNKL